MAGMAVVNSDYEANICQNLKEKKMVLPTPDEEPNEENVPSEYDSINSRLNANNESDNLIPEQDVVPTENKLKNLFKKRIIIATFGVVSITAIVAVMIWLYLSKNRTALIAARSCLDIAKRGITTDGIYEVEPLDILGPFQTYCDVTTDGGGWTLVASIHESNITKKCYPDDLWSVYRDASTVNFTAKSNWENEMIFGNVQYSTTADFKHVGFFAMNASDVMVWHVPNGASLSEWKEKSMLRYRTNNKFLQSNGGSIGAIYKDRHSLTVSSVHTTVAMVLDALEQKSADILKIFPDFYRYAYSVNCIPDKHMYRPTVYGNLVGFETRNPSMTFFPDVAYDVVFTFPGDSSTFSTRTSEPFFAAASILNTHRKIHYYGIYLKSQRPHSDMDTQTVLKNENMVKDNFKLRYEMVQYRYSTYVTIGEFYFVVSNVKDWASVEPKRFYRNYTSDFAVPPYWRENRYVIEGSPVNIIFGYTLLAISNGGVITQDQANKVGEEILNGMSLLNTSFRAGGLSTPVVFDKGSKEDVNNMVPPDLRESVQPGFLQFRAYNASGYPSAFCPGIKTFSSRPEYACVGSISNWLGDHGTCGDFAGWEGEKTDVVITNNASGLAHSQKDISSTILIFQR